MGAFGSEKRHFDKVCLRALLCISASKGPWGSDYNQTTSPLWRVNEVLGQRRTKETHIAPSWSFLFQLPSGKPLHQKNGLEYPPKFRKYLHHGESRWRNLNVSAILGGIPWKKKTPFWGSIGTRLNHFQVPRNAHRLLHEDHTWPRTCSVFLP